MLSSVTPWRRHLSVHEHYSLDMMKSYGMSVPKGEVAMTPEQAKQIADKLGDKRMYKSIAILQKVILYALSKYHRNVCKLIL